MSSEERISDRGEHGEVSSRCGPPDPAPGDGSPPVRASADSAELFSGVDVLSPLDELREVHRRHLRGLHGAGDAERVEQLSRAHDLARRHLLKALSTEPAGAHRSGGDCGAEEG